MIPSRALLSNMLGSSSDANVHPSNNYSLGSLQPLSNNAIKDMVTTPLEFPKTVEELIFLIKSTFAQSFTLNYTQNELKAVYRRESETIEEYGFRVNDILDRGVQATKEDLDSKEFGGITKLFMTSAVTGFLRGLQNDAIASILSKGDIKELREVIKLASRIEKYVNSPRISRNANTSDINPRVLTAEVRKKTCFSCGKTGHFSQECPARPDRQHGRPIRNALRCRKCGKLGQTNLSCRRRDVNRIWRKSRSPVSFNF
uniref:uncharacterized protein LOC117610955 n=1 Tax=Osmia lignaria TaxID=473952 RepID=UPI00147821EF|nr:uncharacterized protein LOC117610955 [Osmia lignaria]